MNRFLLPLLITVVFVATLLDKDMSLAPGLSIKNAFLYLLMVVYVIQMAVFRNRRFELPSVLIPFALFVGYCIVSWFVTSFVVQPDYSAPLETAFTLKGQSVDHLIIFLLFFYGVTTTSETLSLIRIFLWVMVLGNLITVVDAFDIPDLGIVQQRADGRIGGPMGESNQYGAFLAFTLPSVLALLWDSRTKMVPAIGAAVISALTLLASSSRGAFVGVTVGAAFSLYTLRSVFSFRQIGIVAVLVLVMLLMIFGVFLTTDLAGDLLSRITEKTDMRDLWGVSSGRTAIWTGALGHMLESPLSVITGFGWDAYDQMRSFRYNTHNVYLNVFFNLGLPGLVLYLLLLFNMFNTCRKSIARSSGDARTFLIGFVFGLASLGASIFFVDLFTPWIFIWAYAGLAMRLAVASGSAPATEPEAAGRPKLVPVSTASQRL